MINLFKAYVDTSKDGLNILLVLVLAIAIAIAIEVQKNEKASK